jgi:Vps23 core domain
LNGHITEVKSRETKSSAHKQSFMTSTPRESTRAKYRLLNLVADDLAVEETMEILAKALDHERITLDAFLKETRKLAREQFLTKALIQKIVKAAWIENGYVNGGPVVVGGGMTPSEYYYSYPVDS